MCLFLQVIYVLINFYSPLPESVSIERQHNSSWQLWQRFAEDCHKHFGMPNNGNLETATSVNCRTFIE